MNISEAEFEHYDNMAEILKTMGHSLRLAILRLLYEKKKLSVTEIFTELDIEQAVASHHLRLLKRAGIVEVIKSGKNSFYHINNKKIKGIYEIIAYNIT